MGDHLEPRKDMPIKNIVKYLKDTKLCVIQIVEQKFRSTPTFQLTNQYFDTKAKPENV